MMEGIINKKVVTESGVHLGKVVDVVWDTESYVVVQLKVRKGIFNDTPLLVHTSQVVRVEERTIVVYDAVRHRAAEAFSGFPSLSKLGNRRPAPAQRSTGE